jgi:hypothetical protein
MPTNHSFLSFFWLVSRNLQLRTIGGGGGAPEEVPTRENNNFYQLQFYLYVNTTEWCHTNVMQGAITTSTKTRTTIS